MDALNTHQGNGTRLHSTRVSLREFVVVLDWLGIDQLAGRSLELDPHAC